jgi:hypothetical protein
MNLTSEQTEVVLDALVVLNHLRTLHFEPGAIDALIEKLSPPINRPAIVGPNRWTVVKEGAGTGPLRWVTSKADAQAFAQEMAKKYVGTTYLVLCAVDQYRATATYSFE